jgi:hypothetical protein
MSYYYKYNFVSPDPVYATIKEELKSYFDTGAIDDLMFPTYTDKCLKKLGRTTYKIAEYPLYIEDFEARLPDNFIAVREAWMCAEVPLNSYQVASSFYSQSVSCTTIQVTPVIVNGDDCSNPSCTNTNCSGCMPQLIQAVYKTNGEIARSYVKQYLLKPGNISAKQNCDATYSEDWLRSIQEFNPYASSYESFDIRDNKLVTNFRNGIVHLIFYTEEYDDVGNQMVPDNYRIREYIEAFIKYKMFELLYNQTNDETFNQIEKKLVMYKLMSDEAFIMASNEMKKQTPWEKQRRIKNTLNRHNIYKLPTKSLRYGRGRNN